MNGREVAMRQPEMTAMAAYTSKSLRDIYAAIGESTRREGATCAIRHGSSSSRHVVTPGKWGVPVRGTLTEQRPRIRLSRTNPICYRDAERHSS
jgi:hypothetical protein